YSPGGRAPRNGSDSSGDPDHLARVAVGRYTGPVDRDTPARRLRDASGPVDCGRRRSHPAEASRQKRTGADRITSKIAHGGGPGGSGEGGREARGVCKSAARSRTGCPPRGIRSHADDTRGGEVAQATGESARESQGCAARIGAGGNRGR